MSRHRSAFHTVIVVALTLVAVTLADEPVLHIIHDGPVATHFVDELVMRCRKNLTMPIERHQADLSLASMNTESIMQVVSNTLPQRPAGDPAIVLLARSETISTRRLIDRDKLLAGVNITPLRADKGWDGFTAEQLWVRRVAKEGLFVLASLQGFQTCVFPLCVMHDYPLEDRLDMKAPDICPICLQREREARTVLTAPALPAALP